VLAVGFLSSCARQANKVRSDSPQNLRLSVAETYALSVLCDSAAGHSCDSAAIHAVFDLSLRQHGIRLVPAPKASRTLAVECRELPRNEPPLAPGSRLWYQRRIFSPVSTRTSSSRFREGPLRIKVTIRPAQATEDNFQPAQFQATTVVRDRTESGLRQTVDFLINAIQ
jgi:hypothetical protein